MIRYFFKTFFSIFVPFAVLTSMLIFINFRLSERNAENFYKEILKTYWILLSRMDLSDNLRNAAFLNELSRDGDLRITLLNTDGEVLFDSSVQDGIVENHKFREEIRRALYGEGEYSVRRSQTTGKYSIYYAAPLSSDRILRVASDGVLFHGIYAKTRFQVSVIFPLFTLLILLLSLFLTYRSVKPTVQLSTVAKAVRKDENDFIIPEISDPMINRVASLLYSVNRSRLKEKRSREKEAVLLKKIIDHIDESVVLLSESGNVIVSNRQALALFGKCVGESAVPQECEEDCETAAFFQTVTEKKDKLFRLPFKNRLYEIYMRMMDANRLVVLRDISVRADYEDYKAELTANVAHELKTPLAVIMGTAETLLGNPVMSDDIRNRFLDKIYRSSARLDRFVNQILELSRMENSGMDIEEPTVIETVFSQLILKPSGKTVILRHETQGAFSIDSFHTEMILTNLINNAVKYSEGREIDVLVRREGVSMVIEVADQGPVISEKERKRIFERFYTVSKSRRKAGFGLGLSIVRHIASLYKGEACVDVNRKGGNTFRVVLYEKSNQEESDEQ